MSGILPHQPVLYQDIILALMPQREGLYVDGTVGAGGHAYGILESSSPEGKLLGLDVDPVAIHLANERLAPFGERAILVRASYTTLQEQLNILGWPLVDGILLDLGVSSMQVNEANRGFSFQADALLDMRFDPQNPLKASDLVNDWTEQELADVIFRYGEERRAYQVARAIVRARPIHTTGELAQVVSRVTRGGREGLHPATRTFQALRIAVNSELDSLENVLPQAINALRSGGRLAVIAFHSLEDRLVKQFIRRESRDCLCPPKQPICTCSHRSSLKDLTPHPIRPSVEEMQANPRSRSARLRIAVKL
jgi:16S rRNA (cytosine1402-N4)-methyltransferase